MNSEKREIREGNEIRISGNGKRRREKTGMKGDGEY